MFKPPGPEDLKFKTSEDGYVHIHPSSLTASVGYFKTPYLVFHEKIKTSRVFVREVSMVPMYPMVLFGGTGVDVVMQRGQFVLSLENGWIKFVCETHIIAELLKVSVQDYHIIKSLGAMLNFINIAMCPLGDENRIGQPSGREDCITRTESDDGQKGLHHN